MQENHSQSTPDSRYVRPQRAADLMKAAQAIHQTVYIYADSGYGKTAFIQDYFSHRKYAYYSASDSQIISHLRLLLRRKGSILVLDDLHLLTESEERRQFCAILEQILVAERTWVILISRCPLPPWLKGLYIQHIFVTIAEKDLELSPTEMDQYFAKWKLSIMPQNREYLESLCRGYPLALRIACLRLAELESDGKDNLQREKEEVETLQQARKDFWDYLESNVFDYWAVELQEFLMDISIVDTFDVQMAQLITKKPHIGRYLSMAFESGNYLTEMAQEDHTFYTLRQAVRMSFRRRLMRRCSQSHIVNYYIFNEFVAINDTFSASTYFTKDVRGKLEIGPVWDYNNAWNNYIYPYESSGFLLSQRGWYAQLMKSESFVDQVVSRYKSLRKGILSDEYLEHYILETVDWLGSAVDRNFSVWGYSFDPDQLSILERRRPISGDTTTTIYDLNPSDFKEALDWMLTYIRYRGDWLDHHIDSLYQYCQTSKNAPQILR